MGISTNEFHQILDDELKHLADDRGYDWSKNADKGYAFQEWIASLILNYEGFDQAVEDVMQLSGDKGTDLVIEDVPNKTLLLLQCKYTGKRRRVEMDELSSFLDKHTLYSDPAWLRRTGNDFAIDLLGSYPERAEEGWRFEYRFVTNAQASPDLFSAVDRKNEDYNEAGTLVQCELVDFGRLKEYYQLAQGLEEPIPQEVTIALPSDVYFEKFDPYHTLVAVLRGNTLRGLYGMHKSSLYAWNIRGYLGNQGINKAIIDTANNRPADFFYFNNGVAAVCTDFKIEEYERNKYRVVAQHLQIINGAQTVSSLWKAPPSDVEVLFRLTETLSVSTEKGINQDIIRYNNSQNAIKLSDFRSNDAIQQWLDRNLQLSRPKGYLPSLHYLRKRAVGRKQARSASKGIKLEDLGKIRYSFIYEDPDVVSANPKALWTSKDDGGLYELAFGVDGVLEDAWSAPTLEETYCAIACYFFVVEKCSELGSRDDRMKFLSRMRYLILSLAGIYIRLTDQPTDCWRRKTEFLELMDDFWNEARPAVTGEYRRALSDEVSLFALVRSSDRWRTMKEAFELSLLAR